MDFILNPEQRLLIDALKKWYRVKNKPYFVYTGPGGVGKTSVIKYFINEMKFKKDEVQGIAFIGKASLALARHGINASTIHSLIYDTIFESVNVMDNRRDSVIIQKKSRMKFVLKERLSKKLKLIIVDEGSMVNDILKDHILSFNIPTVFMGDMNQLPPVFGTSSIMKYPDFILTQIMRQAQDNPIIYLSQCILNDIPLKYGQYGTSRVIDRLDVNKNILTDYDIILCGKNKTKENINNEIRHNILKIDRKEPIIGDKMISEQNDWSYAINGIYLTNGTIGYVTDIDYSTLHKKYIEFDFKPEFMKKCFRNIELDYKYLLTPSGDKHQYGISKFHKFDFGYAITTHKSQGSEFPNVLFVDEPFYDKDTLKMLRYTAITRARESITIVKSSHVA